MHSSVIIRGTVVEAALKLRKFRIKMIVAKNKEVDSSKREDRNIKCIKTRSAIVVI
jgi:hypothetical protein